MAKESRPNFNLLMIAGLIGILLLALIFDLIITGFAERNAVQGGLGTTLVWIFPLLQMLFMVALIGLLWLVLSAGSYSRWVCVIYLLVGLFLLYANPILYTNELPDSWYVIVQFLSPYSLVTQVGGAAAAFGLVTLFFWQGNKQTQDEDTDE